MKHQKQWNSKEQDKRISTWKDSTSPPTYSDTLRDHNRPDTSSLWSLQEKCLNHDRASKTLLNSLYYSQLKWPLAQFPFNVIQQMFGNAEDFKVKTLYLYVYGHDDFHPFMWIHCRQSLFITCSGLYAFLLIVICLAFLTSEVVTDNR